MHSILGLNNLYGSAMSQKLSVSVSNFEWINNTSQFNVDFIKTKKVNKVKKLKK